MSKLEELQAEAEKLVSLLKDRQVGLSTWHTLLAERIKNIKTIMSELGFY